MIISHKYKFIFIKTRKTASTSIECFLSRLCSPEDIITPIDPPVARHSPRNYEGFKNHLTAKAIQARVTEDIWNSYYRFCVERNPYDKVLSYYYYDKHKQPNLTLEEYVLRADIGQDWNMYTANDGRILVHNIVQYDSLSLDLAAVFYNLGIPFSGDLGVRAKGDYRTDYTPPKKVFTAEQLAIIEKKFHREIEYFKYRVY